MLKKYFILNATAILFLLFPGCRKEEPVDSSNTETPVFFFKGTVRAGASSNNMPGQINIKAGMNNYFMYSSFIVDSNNVTEFVGDLKPYGCTTNCPNSLKIRIRSIKTGVVQGSDVNSSLEQGYYVLAIPGGNSSEFTALMDAVKTNINDSAATFQWDFGDGGKGTGDSISHLYKRMGDYLVSYTVNSPSLKCSASASNMAKIGPASSGFEADFTADTDSMPPAVFFNSILINAYAPPYTYFWDLGENGATSPMANPVYTYSTTGVHKVSLTVTDSNKVSYTRSYEVGTYGHIGCVARYTSSVSGHDNPLNLSTVIIEWRDANGILYSSYNDLQQRDYTCQILSVEPYQKNANGQSTKKIRMRVSCTLYGPYNTSILLENAEIVFAVAHP